MWKLVFFMRSQEWVELLELQEHDEKTMALKKTSSTLHLNHSSKTTSRGRAGPLAAVSAFLSIAMSARQSVGSQTEKLPVAVRLQCDF